MSLRFALLRSNTDITQLMQYVNAQATEAQERLANSTFEVGLAAQKEAIVMRIITVVTLLFLPATFVSVSSPSQSSAETIADHLQTFFSTDVVKYQGEDHGGSWSDEAMNRWLQVTIPLTALTLLIAGIGYRYERRRQILKRHVRHVNHSKDSEKVMSSR
jgi:hypothetical protein